MKFEYLKVYYLNEMMQEELQEEEMYLTTGEMARMFNLNKQTLFYYDKEKLLIPEVRDPDTGYRRYRYEQIYRLALICYLRKIGFSVVQIREYIEHRTVETSIQELKQRSRDIRRMCDDILKTDDAIQRKILFAEQKIRHLKVGEATEKYYLRRAYLPLGKEENIYTREEFYFYPTIALYHYLPETDSYEITFGAYLDTLDDIDPETAKKIQYVEEQRFLCYFWKGNYRSIEEKIRELRREYSHLSLSADTCNFNIIDQFLEKDTDEYVTEIQIPIRGERVQSSF